MTSGCASALRLVSSNHPWHQRSRGCCPLSRSGELGLRASLRRSPQLEGCHTQGTLEAITAWDPSPVPDGTYPVTPLRAVCSGGL